MALSLSLSVRAALRGAALATSTQSPRRICAQLQAPASRAYHQNIVDHYESPRNVGALDKSDRSVGTGLVGAPACGDVMKLQIRVGADGRIAEAKFKTFGCGSAIASSSVATEWVKGRTVDEVLSIRNTDIAAHLKLPPVKLHCSMLAEDAIKAAVADYAKKQQQPAAAAAGAPGGTAKASAASA
jgi:nitrogen fixation NifU-like protein